MATVTVIPAITDVTKEAAMVSSEAGKVAKKASKSLSGGEIAAITAGVLALVAGAEWLRRSFFKKRAKKASAAADDAAAAKVVESIEERLARMDRQIHDLHEELDKMGAPLDGAVADIRTIAEALGTNPKASATAA